MVPLSACICIFWRLRATLNCTFHVYFNFLALLCRIQQRILHIFLFYGPRMLHETALSVHICNLWPLHAIKNSTFHVYFNFLATMCHIKWHILCVLILYSAARCIQQHPLHVAVSVASVCRIKKNIPCVFQFFAPSMLHTTLLWAYICIFSPSTLHTTAHSASTF